MAADRLQTLDPSVQFALWRLVGPDVEHEAASMRTRVADLEATLRDLDSQGMKFARADAGQADLIARTEDLIGELESESTQISCRLPGLKIEEDRLCGELELIRSSSKHLIQAKEAYNERVQEVGFIEVSLSEFIERKEKMERMRAERAKLEVEMAAVEGEIEELKAEITTAVQLAEKYGAGGLEGVQKETRDDLHELAATISQLEAEIAMLPEAGFGGGFARDAAELHELKRVIGCLAAKKKKLEGEMPERRKLGDELHRVEQLMRAQRKEIDEELARLAEEINRRNVEISNWVSLTSSFESWSSSKTFISELRRKYL
jgi:chromosome segregation ATPase